MRVGFVGPAAGLTGLCPLAGSELLISPTPTAYFGAGAAGRLPGVVRGVGGDAVVVVTDAALAATGVVASITAALAAAGMPVTVFSGVHPNPTTSDLADGAAAVRAAARAARPGRPPAPAQPGAPARPAPPSRARIALVAVGGGSAIDAAKGIALAAVNPQRGRDLDYRGEFARPALPLVAVPTTAGTGAETNAFGVVTDPQAGRKFYVGHASALPAAAILDPCLTLSLPPAATAATGLDALVHALESFLSVRASPWSDGIALQVIRMIAVHLPRACADGADLEARAQMLLAAHMAGIGMATTGLGLCHAIGHALGGRFGLAHGVALAAVLPHVLRFNAEAGPQRLAEVAFALGAGSARRGAAGNAAAAIEAIAGLAGKVGLTPTLSGLGITDGDFGQITADALDDEVLASTPRPPSAADIRSILDRAC
ncbi:MAG TPA: iron-containing alcohol dehydrogenase [Streptosporangiaceae bacterium]|nr:iron-containing alcohol dehydrogenase [Streptosporangiaceae bacterium]